MGILVSCNIIERKCERADKIRIVAIIVGFCFFLMFFFVPETFWDRTPQPRSRSQRPALRSISNIFTNSAAKEQVISIGKDSIGRPPALSDTAVTARPGMKRGRSVQKVEFTRPDLTGENSTSPEKSGEPESDDSIAPAQPLTGPGSNNVVVHDTEQIEPTHCGTCLHDTDKKMIFIDLDLNSNDDIPAAPTSQGKDRKENGTTVPPLLPTGSQSPPTFPTMIIHSENPAIPIIQRYTSYLRTQPPKTFKQTLQPWNGKIQNEKWLLVALRPFILFAYPSILWSTLVYSLSIGWLIVLSESVSTIYRNRESYNFSSLGTGLVYISPFVGGILGTAVAGKVSDIIVRFMSRRNGGIYEPEFRLVMAIPVTISTCMGLMGYGWSAEEKDKWIVPTVFFGIISFGCSLGSTTAITFAVDSYRQYAGEALVTLNFSKSMSRFAIAWFL